MLVDHLIPPMARAETYGDIARLEQLLDEHSNIAALDPGKLPAIRQQIWTLMRAAKMDHDLGLEDRPDEDVFDDMLLHVDGWLCEIKDVQIRDGLHMLGQAPDGCRRTRPGAGHPARPPAVRRRAVGAGPASGARPGRGRHGQARGRRRRRGAGARPGGRAAGNRLGPHGRRPDHRQRRRRRRAAVRGRGGGAAAAADRLRDHPDPAGARRRFHRGRAVGLAAARSGQRAAHRTELLFRGPQGGAVPAGLGNRCGPGGFATRALPRRPRGVAAVGGAVGVGHLGDAHLG